MNLVKSTIKAVCICFVIFVFSQTILGCTGVVEVLNQVAAQLRDIDSRIDGLENRNNNSDDDDRRSNDRSNTRNDGDTCEDDRDCEQQCERLFSGRAETDCLKFSVNEIQEVYDAFEDRRGYLTDPDRERNSEDGNLDGVNANAIRNAENIDEDIWTDRIKDYSKKQAVYVLYWLSQQDVFREVQNREDVVSELFSSIDNNNITQVLFKEVLTEDDQKDTDLFFNLNRDEELGEVVVEQWLEELESECRIPNESDKNIIVPSCALSYICIQDRNDDYYMEDQALEAILDYDQDDTIRDYIRNSIEFPTRADIDEIEDVCRAYCTVPSTGRSPDEEARNRLRGDGLGPGLNTNSGDYICNPS